MVESDKNLIKTKTEQYIPKAIPATIKFTSRASVKIRESHYTIEYGEERQIIDYNEVNLDKEREALIDDCNSIVDKQIEELVRLNLKN